ncbi:hypothetical protein AB1Y20_023468 [Prymnesium parvum]|uniref:LIM zinc-binding domain-containing protein n=1 Tax=Prymnesium parvum TaxID=97485 RepID=A0AB34JEK9_PRYPA
MGFCASCGEVVSNGPCRSCGATATIKPVTYGEGTQSTTSDKFIPAFAESAAMLGSLSIVEPPPHAEPEPFHRGKTCCAQCYKTIGGEAVALDDGRIWHSTCLLCSRCGVRTDEYKPNGLRVFCESCGPPQVQLLKAVALQDTTEKIKASEWYFSNGDSSEGPVSFDKLRALFKAGTLAPDGYVWGTHMAADGEWAQLSDPANAELLDLLRSSGRAGGGKPPPMAAPKPPPAAPVAPPPRVKITSKAPWLANADHCSGCGQELLLDVVGALGGKWHPNCFVCAGCSQPFTNSSFMEHGNKAYHKQCYQNQFGTACKGCGKVIDGKFVTSPGGDKYHSTCFVCAECRCTLEGGFALSPDGHPFCAKHAAMASKPKNTSSNAAAEAAMVAAAMEGSRANAAKQAGEAAAGGDGFTVDIRTGELVYVESGTKRKYRLGPHGNKLYEDEKSGPAYGGATTFLQAGATSYNSGGRGA